MITKALLLSLLLAGAPPAQPANDVSLEKQRQDEVSQIASAKAKRLEVVAIGDAPVKATLHDDPLLRWSNPTVGSVHGEVFVWTVDGKPAAVASIFRWYHPYEGETIEIVSLAPSPVEASEDGEREWRAPSAGVTFRAEPDAPAPAAQAGGRLAQMRSMARRFSAELEDQRGGEPVNRSLRLLNQPLFRYACKEQGVVDGAIFAFAEVNDPEVLVVIEALESGWRFAIARMNNHALEVKRDGAVLESWPRIADPWNHREAAYTLYSFEAPETNKEPTP